MRPPGARSLHPLSGPAPAQRRNGRRGFTLIELAVVVLIIGILSSLAVYTYRMMVNKARMTQAKTVLAHLARTEAIFYASYDRYTDNVVKLDFDPMRYPFYQVSVVLDNSAQGFTGYARGVGLMTGDLWFVTQNGNPTQDNTSTFRN
jgi:prepilin-type N-terminal cleavage/methylation domain-containing protein